MRMKTEVDMAYLKTLFCLSQSTYRELKTVGVEAVCGLPQTTDNIRKHENVPQ
jgi:hypothetical protein